MGMHMRLPWRYSARHQLVRLAPLALVARHLPLPPLLSLCYDDRATAIRCVIRLGCESRWLHEPKRRGKWHKRGARSRAFVVIIERERGVAKTAVTRFNRAAYRYQARDGNIKSVPLHITQARINFWCLK